MLSVADDNGRNERNKRQTTQTNQQKNYIQYNWKTDIKADNRWKSSFTELGDTQEYPRKIKNMPLVPVSLIKLSFYWCCLGTSTLLLVPNEAPIWSNKMSLTGERVSEMQIIVKGGHRTKPREKEA